MVPLDLRDDARDSPPPVKIAYLLPVFPKGSETFVYREVDSLRRLGFQTTVYSCARPDLNELGRLSGVARGLAASTHYLGRSELVAGLALAIRSRAAVSLNRTFQRSATRKSHALLRLARAGAVVRRLRRDPADRLHAHWPYASQVAALVHVLTGLPLDVGVHAHEVVEDNGHFPALWPHVDLVHFCNATAMRHLLDRLPPGSESKTHLVYHGVDLAAFRFRPMPSLDGGLRLIAIGRLSPVKRFDRLLRQISELRARGHDLTLTIVGDGSARAGLEAQRRALRLEPHVEITGWLPLEEVGQQLGRSHVLLMLVDPDHNGIPNVVLEAQAVGRPSIIGPVPAAAEALDAGRTGFVLSDAGDVDAIESILLDLRSHPQRLAEMGAAARVRIESQFDESTHARRLAALLRGERPAGAD